MVDDSSPGPLSRRRSLSPGSRARTGVGEGARRTLRAGLVALTLLTWATSVGAQARTSRTLSLIPQVGLGAIVERGEVVSGSAVVLAELEWRRGAVDWLAHGSVRGIGAACADGCDLSGSSLGLGVRRTFGRVRLGGGLGGLRQSGKWHLEPHLQVAIGRRLVQGQLRADMPRGAYGAVISALVGVRVPSG